MKTLAFLAVLSMLSLLSARVFAEELELGQVDDVFYIDEAQAELQRPLLGRMLQRIARQKPVPGQFIGLMGKRNNQLRNFSSKRQGANSFIGLMGKRSLDKGSADWNPIQNPAWEYN